MRKLSVNDIRDVRKYLSMFVELDDADEYTFGQDVEMEDTPMQSGLAEPEKVPSSLGDGRNDVNPEKSQCLKKVSGMMIDDAIFSSLSKIVL